MPYSEMQKPYAILFDWDNTLVDTMPLICASINKALTHFGMGPWSEAKVKQEIQLSARDGLPAFFGERWQQALSIYRDYYHQHHLDFLTPFDGAHDLIEYLHIQKIPMGLVSNKQGDTLRKEVCHLKWDHYFSAVIGAGDAEKDKPNPEPARLALEQMQQVPSLNVWFIGDAPVDWQCAEAIGCWPIPIRSIHQEAKSYQQAIKNCSDLEKILAKL